MRGGRGRSGAVLLIAVCAAAGPLAAQQARLGYWRTQYYPIAYYGGNTGLVLRGFFQHYAPVPFDWPQRNAFELRVAGEIGTRGYRMAEAEVLAPAWWDGWRAAAAFAVMREGRFYYFGVGNDAPRDDDLVTDTSENFYRARRTLVRGRIDVQWRVVGPLRVLAGVGYRRSVFDPLPGPTQLDADLASGRVETASLTTGALVPRIGIVFDSRDSEADPFRGIFAEALVGSHTDFARVTGQLRAYLPAGERLRLAARVAGERMGGSVPFGEIFFLESSEGGVPALGGYYAHRALSDNRFVNAGKLLASVDARYTAFGLPTAAEVVLFAYLDGGRVFDAGHFELTARDLYWGGGGGAALKLGRASIAAVTLGAGPDGFTAHFGTGWSY